MIADLSVFRRYAFAFAWSSSVLLQGAYVPPHNPGTWMEAVFLVFANVFAFSPTSQNLLLVCREH